MNTADDQLIEHDKISEEEMAERLGITKRALQTRRLRGQIPFGVWNKFGRDVIYSVRRYEEWLERVWDCPPGSSLQGSRFESGSLGKEQSHRGAVKPSPSRKRKKASQQPPLYVLK